MTDIVAVQIAAHRLLLGLASRLPVLPVFAPGRAEDEHGEQDEQAAAHCYVERRHRKLQAIYVVFVETGRAVLDVIAPQRRTDTRVQFRTPIREKHTKQRRRIYDIWRWRRPERGRRGSCFEIRRCGTERLWPHSDSLT